MQLPTPPEIYSPRDQREMRRVLTQTYAQLSAQSSVLPSLWYNVTDAKYGAQGDGVTDDIGALELAVEDCLANGGGAVYLPAGTYRISRTLALHASAPDSTTTPICLQFFGDMWATVIKPDANVTGDAVVVTGTASTDGMGNSVFMSDLEIDCVDATNIRGLRVGTELGTDTGCARHRFTNLNIMRSTGTGGIGVLVADTVDSMFINCYFGRSYINVRLTGQHSALPTVTNFINCQFREAETYGIYITRAYNTHFVMPYIESNGLHGLRVVTDTHAGPPATVDNVTLLRLDGGWFENNFNLTALSLAGLSYASAFAAGLSESATYASNSHVVVDGSAAGTASIIIEGTRFSGVIRAVTLIRAVNCKLDGILPSVVQYSAAGVIEATATGYSRSTGSWVSDGFVAGMQVNVVGFPTSGNINNGRHVLTAVTATDLSCTGTVPEVPAALQTIQVIHQTIFIDSASNGTLQNWATNNAPLRSVVNDAPAAFSAVDMMYQGRVYVDDDGHLTPATTGTSLITGYNLGSSTFRFQRVYAYTLDGTELVVSGKGAIGRLAVHGGGAFDQYGIVVGGSATPINPSGGAAYGIYVASQMTAVADNDVMAGLYLGPTSADGGFTGVQCNGIVISDVTAGATNYAIRTGLGQVAFGGEFAANGAAPQAAVTYSADATDLASAITLVNELKTMAVDKGL